METQNNREMGLHIVPKNAGYEVRRRTPWLLFGVLAGVAMVFIAQGFEEQLSRRVELAFLIPVIVYISGSIGAETLALFVRELALHSVHVKKLLFREVRVGLSLGFITGLPMSVFSYLAFRDWNLAFTVWLAMFLNGLVAVLLGILIPTTFMKLGRDPALGSDELTTALSDIVSILIYLAIAVLVLF